MRVFTMISCVWLLTASHVQGQPEMKISDRVQKFAKTAEGQPLHFVYLFQNSGDHPLIINEAKVSCECTEVTFPSAPIAPGQSDSILVDFDTRGKIGYQERKIEIKSNAAPVVLVFKGVVKASKATKEQYRQNN